MGLLLGTSRLAEGHTCELPRRIKHRMNQSAERLQFLLQRSRVLGLTDDETLPANSRRCIGAADAERRPLSQDELQLVCAAAGTDSTLPQLLQVKADALVDAARGHLLQQQPALTEPGGALHPEERAEACWRDCWNFLRVISYAVAAGHCHFTDPSGMEALRDLYTMLGVPIDGMIIALKELQHRAMDEASNPEQITLVEACFEHLLQNLNKSAVKS